MSETYSFKSYLTWSTFHLFYLPIIIILNKARDFYNNSNADCANDVFITRTKLLLLSSSVEQIQCRWYS